MRRVQRLGQGRELAHQIQTPIGQRHRGFTALQLQPRLAPAFGHALLVARHGGNFLRRIVRTGVAQAMQQKHVQETQGLGVDANWLKGIEVHQAHFDIFDPAFAQRVQRAFPLKNYPLGTDGAVKLVLDLQQAGRQLAKVPVWRLHANGFVRSVGHGQCLVQGRGVAFQAVVAHGQRALGVALVAQAAHAQRGGVGQAHGAGAQGLQRMAAPGHKRFAHRRRGAKQIQEQKRVAAKVTDQPEIRFAGQTRHRPVVVNARDGLHAPPIAVAQTAAVHRFGLAHVGAAVLA